MRENSEEGKCSGLYMLGVLAFLGTSYHRARMMWPTATQMAIGRESRY